MAWDKRGYYYRSERDGRRVRRMYVGAGRAGEIAAQLDALAREERWLKALDLRDEKAELDALDAPLNELNDVADLLAHAALLAAGYHQHKRGEWRKRRAQSNASGEAGQAV